MTRSFTPTGLDGYSIRQADGWWWVDLLPGQVRTFRWNEATNKHDIPERVDGPFPFCMDRRSTAKGAVAAAHAHKRMVEAYS